MSSRAPSSGVDLKANQLPGRVMPLTVDDLLQDPPPIHGDAADPRLYGLQVDALRFLERAVQPGFRTLETGSGHSTIVFAARGADHTCVVPNLEQIERVRAYCDRRGVPIDRLRFELGLSERVLPFLERTRLDVVLLDGSHSFPQVFIDWFFTADRLGIGGHLLVDDIHLWTGKVLHDFLRAEPGWTAVSVLGGRTAVLRKEEGTDLGREWTRQPYVASRSRRDLLAKARVVVAMARGGQLDELARTVRRFVRGR
jgi:hypothetical protein